MTRQQHFWTSQEEAAFRDLLAAGKSWTLISAKLGRPIKQLRDRDRFLRRRARLRTFTKS